MPLTLLIPTLSFSELLILSPPTRISSAWSDNFYPPSITSTLSTMFLARTTAPLKFLSELDLTIFFSPSTSTSTSYIRTKEVAVPSSPRSVVLSIYLEEFGAVKVVQVAGVPTTMMLKPGTSIRQLTPSVSTQFTC